MGGKQLGFSDYELTTDKKQTKREKFLSEMEVVVPWQALIALIEPHYPKTSKNGARPPYPLATMLRIHLLQQWYSLSDPAMEEARIAGPIRSHPDGCAVAGFLHPSSISSPLMSCAKAAMPSVTDQIPFSRRLLIAMVRSMATI